MEDLLSENDRMRSELEKMLNDVYRRIHSDRVAANKFSWALQMAWWGFHRNSVCLIRLFDKEGAYYPTSMIARFLMETAAEYIFCYESWRIRKTNGGFFENK